MRRPTDRTPSPCRIALLPIGRELLTGRVQDTNSRFLAGRFFEMGLRVIRICTVDDDPVAIGREMRRCRADGASVIVCTGGLGPTPDDLTLGAVAMAIGRPLVEDPDALAHVERRYRELHEAGRLVVPGLTPDRRKMAWLPRGARMLSNRVGTAPGVEVRWGRVRVFCLPGVPTEMQPMAEEHLFPAFAATGGPVVRRLTLTFGVCDESSLAGVIRRLQPDHPGVVIKPEPKGYGAHREMRVHLECEGEAGEVAQRLRAAARALEAALADLAAH